MTVLMFEWDRQEAEAVHIALKSAGYKFRFERDTSGYVKVTFTTPPDVNVNSVIQQAIRNHRLRNLGNYDDLNILQYTPAQVATWIENNVTTLAQAKTVLKALAKLNLYLLRRMVDED